MKKTVLFLLLCVFGPSFAGEQTNVVLYQAFGRMPGQVNLQPAEVLNGHCVRQSQKSPREDAWRCLTSGAVYDPCYVRRHVRRNEVVCPISPWQADAVILKLERPLPKPKMQVIDAQAKDPWMLELASGEHCWRLLNNPNIRYNCTNNIQLTGAVQRCKGLWRVNAGAQPKQITKAWY